MFLIRNFDIEDKRTLVRNHFLESRDQIGFFGHGCGAATIAFRDVYEVRVAVFCERPIAFSFCFRMVNGAQVGVGPIAFHEAILPLNIYAHVILVGTVTMQGSIVHQIVKANRGEVDEGEGDEGNRWVLVERIVARHHLPIVVDDGGMRRSVWPEKWPLAFLESIERTRQYAKNYANDPLGADGDYWQIDDFERLPAAPLLPLITHEVISVDPAVTSKESSDATAIAAVGWSREAGKCVVYEATALRLPPDDVRLKVLASAERALARGHAVLVIVETNQGGELWSRILHGLPFRVKTYTVSAPKQVRAADALDHYQRGRVAHVRNAPGVRDAEGEMVAFPRAPHDDRVDAVGAGVRYFLSRGKRARAGAESVAY